MGAAAKWAIRIPAGHPEGYFEAFAQLYTDLAEQITARLEERDPDPRAMLVPGVEDGVLGVQFILAALGSARNSSVWTSMPSPASISGIASANQSAKVSQ